MVYYLIWYDHVWIEWEESHISIGWTHIHSIHSPYLPTHPHYHSHTYTITSNHLTHTLYHPFPPLFSVSIHFIMRWTIFNIPFFSLSTFIIYYFNSVSIFITNTHFHRKLHYLLFVFYHTSFILIPYFMRYKLIHFTLHFQSI